MRDDPAMLRAMAGGVRGFLLPHWSRWHREWGPPYPVMPSQWTCVRSSLLLVKALRRRGVRAMLRSGCPDRAASCGVASDAGMSTADGWASHAWVEAAGQVIDVTADQFGDAPVVVVPVADPRYRPGPSESCRLTPTKAGIAAVAEIWPEWCRRYPVAGDEAG